MYSVKIHLHFGCDSTCLVLLWKLAGSLSFYNCNPCCEFWWHSVTHKGLWESSLHFEHGIPGGRWHDDCVILHYGVTQIVGKATTSTKQKRMCKWAAWWLCNTPLWPNTNCWQSNNLHKAKTHSQMGGMMVV